MQRSFQHTVYNGIANHKDADQTGYAFVVRLCQTYVCRDDNLVYNRIVHIQISNRFKRNKTILFETYVK